MEICLSDAYARFAGSRLTLGTAQVVREWLLTPQGLLPLRLHDREHNRDWLHAPAGENAAEAPVQAEVQMKTGALLPDGAEAVVVTILRAGETEENAQALAVFPQSSVLWHRAPAGAGNAAAAKQAAATAGGIETDPPQKTEPQKKKTDADGMYFPLALDNLLLHQIELFDQTDGRDNLLHWRTFRLCGVERPALSGCLFALEDPLTRTGILFLKNAPLPHARPAANPAGADLIVEEAGVRLPPDAGNPYPVATILFEDGKAGITRALQDYRRLLHPYRPGRDGLTLSNTWGDRNRDGALSEEFIKQEMAAAQRLGVEVCQIDDGWQRGVSANSVIAKQAGGVWEGFYAADPDFWTTHPQRLPHGLSPLAQEATARNVGLGLWFAPDSAHDFANWRRDADNLLRLHRTYGVRWIKIDGVKSRTPSAERNLQSFFRAVLRESAGGVLFDLDVTAEVRPGYFGCPEAGTLFIENRYTDWKRYWPHATFRNLWQLAHALPPAGLRLEWLNPLRNAEKYGDDPLAPARIPVCYTFATLMVASPLLWCELSRIAEPVASELAASIALWKQHRFELHTATVYPIGDAPDGGSWSGFFLSGVQNGRAYWHLLSYRERNPATKHWFSLPAEAIATLEKTGGNPAAAQRILGNGTLEYRDGMLGVTLAQPLECGWWRGACGLPSNAEAK